MKNLICLMLLLSFAVFAESDGDSNIYVHTMGDFDGDSLKQEGVVVTKGIPSVSHTGGLPVPAEIQKYLEKTGLTEVKAWDQFDIDVLCVRLKTKPFEEVEARYARLEKEKLKNLKALLEAKP